ncbi:MAG TPA: cupin domain-containing protein [Planctomycetota bacterium]|nr:cupin domain-containing protein [Planctomycetota bacterium]
MGQDTDPGWQGVVTATDLVACQAGSVVSRALVRKPVGTVTVFAFAAGQGLSEHTAPYDALVHVLEGEAEVTIAGTPHTVRAGQLLALPAGKAHSLRADKAFKMMLTMIRA